MRAIKNIVATINHIETNLDKSLSLEAVADELGYSRYHLHRMFTKTIGLTIHEYIRRRRLTEAAKLLVFSGKPIIEIALQAGYESQQAFSSIFTSMYKCPPHQFREQEKFYPLQLSIEFDEETLKENAKVKRLVKQTISVAREEYIPEWLHLVRLVIDGFPCLHEPEHIETLKRYITQQSAFIMKDKNIAIGIMMISQKTGSIDFLGIHPLYRTQGIVHALLSKAIRELTAYKEISTTTYREGDKADTGYRDALKELGFSEAELLVEFGYPTQKMVLSTNAFKDICNA
jgi:AraC-like DNA-binding protein